jgi:endonuclease/exonuclease/phosphatase family metal-dependent hydrolase
LAGPEENMKIANWNIEWMNHWFTPDSEQPAFRRSDQIAGVSDVDALAGRVANVIKRMNPDVLTVQEGPSRHSEMALFVGDYLDDSYVVLGPSGKDQQRLFTLVRKDGAATDPERVRTTGKIDFDKPWQVDIRGNQELVDYDFTRVPLVVDVTDQASGRRTRVVNLHLKSKFVQQGEQMWRDPAERPEFVAQAILARRRISAEAMRVREYLDELLDPDGSLSGAALERSVVVCGDCNDGPGNDYFERLYLTHNLVAALGGNAFVPQLMFRHGFIDKVRKEDNYTAIFDDFVDEIPNRKILLDHILLSPGLYWDVESGLIEHAAYEAEIDAGASARQRLPSDHRPQSITF